MKPFTPLVTSLFALASFPLWAQQPPPANQPDNPATQQSPSSTATAPPPAATIRVTPSPRPEAPPVTRRTASWICNGMLLGLRVV